MMTYSNKTKCDQERPTFYLVLIGKSLMKLADASAWEEMHKIISDLEKQAVWVRSPDEIQLGKA